MRLSTIFSAALLLALAGGAASLTACKSSDAEVTAENIESSPEALTEVHDGGSVAWHVTSDGKVKALVKTPDGKPVEKDVGGTLTFKGPSGDAKVPMKFEEKDKILVATGPKLEGDLTEMKYELLVSGKTWNGAIHLPAGGTAQLALGAKKAAELKLEGKVGPNGGVLQVVGEDVVEVVAGKTSGEVRVYVLDADLKPVKVGDRKIKLGFVGASAETVVLVPSSDGLYVSGKVGAKVNPIKLTIAIAYVDHTEVVLVGYSPGVHVIVGTRAPSVGVFVAVGWDVNVKVRTPGVIVIDDDDDDVHVHFHGHGHGRWK